MMTHFRGTAGRDDRAKALVGVLLVHAALGAVILSGLDVNSVKRTVERLKTFDITLPPPPPPPTPPPPQPSSARAKQEEGASGKKALPTPVVAPPPAIPLPVKPPIAAAPVPATGSATTAGAALAGTGTGAGGSGTGPGGGGTGLGGSGRFTPARMTGKIPDREYRRISNGGVRRGSATITIMVQPDGRGSNCRVRRSSGDYRTDALICELAVTYLRFTPAMDPSGKAVLQDITYTPSWRPN